jgi:hypothetical protein
MEERIRYINHKGQRVLLIDLSNCSAQEVSRISLLVPAQTVTEPRGSVLLLADFTGAQFDKNSLEALKQATVFDRPHLKRSAWVGVETLPHVFYENIKSFSQRDLPTFKTREEALDWLVADEQPMASGQ